MRACVHVHAYVHVRRCRELFESNDRKARGFLPKTALTKLFAAANTSFAAPRESVAKLPYRLSLLHVQHVVADLLTEPSTPIRELFDW